MPYKVIGNSVYHLKNGKWSVKQKCSSHEKALAAIKLLRGLESGSIKEKDVGKKKHKVKSAKELNKKNAPNKGCFNFKMKDY